MATAEHVKALVRSHAADDDERFYSVALQVAAHAARNGQSKFAQAQPVEKRCGAKSMLRPQL